MGGIRLNLRGREPQGILPAASREEALHQLETMLLSARDPRTGQSPIQRVYRREALYHGPWVHLAPDLILEPWRDSPEPGRNTVIRAGYATEPFGDTGDLTGNHALQGILALAGPDIPPGRWEDARLQDLAPTILHLLGLPVPEEMDGRVLVLGPGEENRERAGFTPKFTAHATNLSPEEQAAITERLRGLGYLDG